MLAASYLGLTPPTYQSGNQSFYGCITKQGWNLRAATPESARPALPRRRHPRQPRNLPTRHHARAGPSPHQNPAPHQIRSQTRPGQSKTTPGQLFDILLDRKNTTKARGVSSGGLRMPSHQTIRRQIHPIDAASTTLQLRQTQSTIQSRAPALRLAWAAVLGFPGLLKGESRSTAAHCQNWLGQNL